MTKIVVNVTTGGVSIQEYTQSELDAIATMATKSPEQLLAEAKAARLPLVDTIVVTTVSGKQFNGDENSQTRMSRAITALNPLESTQWVLADNTIATVTREEFQEALRLAGEAQTAIWLAPYV